MKITVDRSSSMDPYEQIAQQLRTAILAGELKPGETLPSVREIVHASGVSLATAQRAINELKHAGLVYVRSGRGTFVAEQREEPLKRLHIFLPTTRISFYMEILGGIQTALTGTGLETVMHSLDTDKLLWDRKTIEELEGIQHEPAGVIFIEEAVGSVREMCRKTAARLPFVTIEWQLEGASAVLNNYRESTAAVIDHLVGERKSRKILILKGRDHQFNAREKLLGIVEQSARLGLRKGKDIFYHDTDFDAYSGYNAVIDFIAEHPREPLDAVFCANDYEAMGVIGALNENGLIPGKHVALIGYGDMTDKTTLYFPLSTVNQHLSNMGTAAVEALFRMAAGSGVRKTESIVIPAVLELRKT